MYVQSAPARPSRSHCRVAALVALLALTACDEPPAPAVEPVRPVRVVTVERQAEAQAVALTGTVRAEEEAQLAFRTGGRIIELNVGLGDTVQAGQRVGLIESETQRNAVQAARADLAAAQGELDRTAVDFDRQATLIERGFTTRVRYDQARQALRTAQSWVDTAEARLATANEQLAFTELYADAPGVVTARRAEPGEVVAAGQPIVVLARKGGRDAIFDVPERVLRAAPPSPVITVTLATDRSVTAEGRVREVAPQADALTGTFEVKVGLLEPPEAMRLGSTVTGTVPLGSAGGVVLPSAALTAVEGGPAVFVVDPATSRVALRPVRVARYDLAEVVLEDGVEPGEAVVVAGVQALRPGQEVRLLGGGS